MEMNLSQTEAQNLSDFLNNKIKFELLLKQRKELDNQLFIDKKDEKDFERRYNDIVARFNLNPYVEELEGNYFFNLENPNKQDNVI